MFGGHEQVLAGLGGRSTQLTVCDQNLVYISSPAHSRSQNALPSLMVRASLVKATDLPSPYCQAARIGNLYSPIFSVSISTLTRLDSFGVVRTKPYNGGGSPLIPSVGPSQADDAGLEFLLVNERLADEPAFADVDRGELGRILDVIIAPLAEASDRRHLGDFRLPVRRDADGGAGDLRFHQLGEHAGAGVPVIAVGDEDDVLGAEGVFGVGQFLVSLDEGGIDVGHVAGFHGIDEGDQLSAVCADLLKRDMPAMAWDGPLKP